VDDMLDGVLTTRLTISLSLSIVSNPPENQLVRVESSLFYTATLYISQPEIRKQSARSRMHANHTIRKLDVKKT